MAFAFVLVLGLLLGCPVLAEPLPEVVVVASALRETALATVPASITVLDPVTIQRASIQHFEELIPLVPNLNWSGEGSRARYFQMRGTGELEQYEGAPNASVGFVVDDIDFSDLGGIATTFDAGQVEVLRGPQGTRYGANALAGLIFVRTADPESRPRAFLTATSGGDGARALGGMATGPVPGLADELSYRVAVQRYAADGFRRNAFLGRHDTSGQDELTTRVKLRWQPSERLGANLTAFHVDLENGYDDFAIDNGYTTYADKPGRDTQQTDAAALRVTVGLADAVDLVSISGVARSEIGFSFDADWGNDDYWGQVYDYTQDFARQRRTRNQEFRLVSTPSGRLFGADWVLGLYALELDESNAREDRGEFCLARPCAARSADKDVFSAFKATSVAAFGLLEIPLAPATRSALGLRWEVRNADYADATVDRVVAPAQAPGCELAAPDARACRFTARDHLWGGELTLTQALTPAMQGWARVARGYKAGGFNPGIAGFNGVSPADLAFAPESLWNYELGLRYGPAAGRVAVSASVFRQERNDLQLKLPVNFLTGDPTAFAFFTDNAERGRTQGAELEGTWQARATLTLGASLGLLDTEIRRFDTSRALVGRDLAHAPRYTYAVQASWRPGRGFFLRADYSGKDRYYIDYCQAADCNDPQTRAYQLLGLRAGREWGAWSVEAWCRNVLDKEYAVRGFFFGNEPPDFTPRLYTRLGDPRQAGLTLSRRFE